MSRRSRYFLFDDGSGKKTLVRASTPTQAKLTYLPTFEPGWRRYYKDADEAIRECDRDGWEVMEIPSYIVRQLR